MRMSWVWEMRIDHYGVRNKPHKHGQWGMKQIHELWNSKSGGNMYSYFETKFRALSELYFGKTIYHLEDLEVQNPTLQIICKLDLKWGSYVHLKQIGQRRMLSLKFTVHFELIPLISNWISLFHLWVRNWLGTDLNFEINY